MDSTQSHGLGFSTQARRLKNMTQAPKKEEDKKQNFLNLIQAHEEQMKNLETKL
jgi:hypothetical protein